MLKQSIIIDVARGTVTFLFVLFVMVFLFAAFGRF
jgi:hypothetical protein